MHHVTLDTFRNTHARGVSEWRESWRREKKFSGGGIAMDHGSHTFYLAFDWLKSYPTSLTAKMSIGARDGNSSSIRHRGHVLDRPSHFRTEQRSRHLTWRAGIRKVIYTIHGEKGAIRVEDDDVEVSASWRHRTSRTHPRKSGRSPKRKLLRTGWMRRHTIWFQSLFGRFTAAIENKDYAGKDAQDALRCVELINAAYASAADQSREQRLGERKDHHAGAEWLAAPALQSQRSSRKRDVALVIDLALSVTFVAALGLAGAAYGAACDRARSCKARARGKRRRKRAARKRTNGDALLVHAAR